jgi:hypothetical protein
MPYYLAFHPTTNTHIADVWDIDGKIAKCVSSKQQDHHVQRPWPDLVVDHLPGFSYVQLKLMPGEYHPRIARPSNGNLNKRFNPETPSLRDLIEVSNGQLVALKEQLERICRVVHPTSGTLDAFGHEIRNLLILAATEVETHWKGVLIANDAKAENTRDYVKLSAALKLPAYKITFPHYPWMDKDPIQPFANWKPSDSPTKDLGWYDSYNAVKHDREKNFSRATLRNAFHAVCANFVMLCAQFGMPTYWCRGELCSFFHLSEQPQFDPSEAYCNLPDQPWKAVSYTF